jgi:hypothetical protein
MSLIDRSSPIYTRLSYAKAKDPDAFRLWLKTIAVRVQIYSMAHDGKFWFLWFVPDDNGPDIQSVDLTGV